MSHAILAAGLAAALGLALPTAQAAAPQRPPPAVEIGYLAVGEDITLRRMVLPNPGARRTVLFLHGFPETLHAWRGVAEALGPDFEAHAFDWPGFGLSSRPPAERFSYAPRDYARVLKAYVDKAGLDRSRLTIYATDIGALPALLLALEEPDIAAAIVVGDFAPFDRPGYMYPSLQGLKSPASAPAVRAQLNANRDEILENAFRRGLPAAAQFEVSRAFKDDMARGWDAGAMTSADAFSHYYSHFTRDQRAFEAGLGRLRTPVKVVWGAEDLYIHKDMGAELAARIRAELTVLPGVGHYPHLQAPDATAAEVRAAAR